MSPYNFFVCGPKFTYFSSNVEEVLVNKILVRFATCRSVPEIFVIKVESCQKSRRILDVFFALPNFRGQAFQDLYPSYHSWLVWKKFYEDIPTSSEVIGAHTVNFKPNFKFLRLKFFGGTPSQFGCALAGLGQYACKNFRAQHPLMAEI